EPGDVAQVEQNGGRRGRIAKLRGDLIAKQVFVADVGRNAFALPEKARLAQWPAREIAKRNIQQFGKPAKQRRNEFAEGHKMVLVVAVGSTSTGREPQHRVGIARFKVAQ